MWQEAIVFIIALAVIGYVGKKIYTLLTSHKTENPCNGCSGCALKRETDKNNRVC